ncbi:MAG: hypothetical protein WC249_03365 [Patescibacteria group bacterium]|jgi:hypothetical protein
MLRYSAIHRLGTAFAIIRKNNFMREQLSLARENVINPRERLLKLEKEGHYVFHGSKALVDRLEPQQAYNNNQKDGAPAVFATPFADVAIYRSLINTNNINGPSESQFGTTGDGVYFKASQNLVDSAKNITGKIYVLDREKFKNFKGTECRLEEPIDPIEVIEVTANDLPTNIEIIEISKRV